MANFFFLTNGTQLINSIEYIYTQRIDKEENKLYVITTSNSVRKDLTGVVGLYNWSEVFYVFPKWMIRIPVYELKMFLSALYFLFKSNKLINKSTKRIVLGNYQNHFCKSIMKANTESKVIIVDDGPGSIEFRMGFTKTGDRAKMIVHTLLRVKNYYVRPDEFFTSFTKEMIIESDGPKLVQNHYGFLKKRAGGKESNGEILFIGYPLVEEGCLEIESLKSLIQRVKDRFPELVYIPHRRESAKNLQVLSDVLEVRSLGLPFELYLAENASLRRSLVGYFSSVLFNTNKMFGDTIELNHIRLRDYKSPHFSDLDILYNKIDDISEEIFQYSISNKKYI